MAKYSMFSDEMLSEALISKDRVGIINLAILTINYDSSFSNGEFERLIDVVKKEFPDAFDKKVPVDGEYVLPENEWDDDYFMHLLYNLRSNFCLERIDEVEKAGKALYKKNAVNANPTIPQLSEETPVQKTTEAKPINQKTPTTMKTTRNTGRTTSINFKKAAVILAIILLILIVVIFAVKGKKANDNPATAVNGVNTIVNTEVSNAR